MTIRVALVSLFAICTLTLGACSTWVLVDGYTLKEVNWVRDRSAILSRASFEMQCPAEQLALTVLNAYDGAFASQVGVHGCERRVVYVHDRTSRQWMANSLSDAPAQ